jgi:Predicted sugar kinase
VIVAHPEKPEALRLAAEAERKLGLWGADVLLSISLDDTLNGFDADLAVVFGGDGTVLGAVDRLGENPPPILAFNMGRLGYLADNPPERMAELIREALSGWLQASERMMVDASLAGRGEERSYRALNEFAIVGRHNGRLVPVSVRVSGEELMDIRGDGVIVSTATGSTAYAMAAGGPVASPELKALILIPVCPHQLANRSLVLEPNETVELTHQSEHPVELMADGRLCGAVEKGDVLAIRMSRTVVKLLSPARGRYKVLRDKLGWGWKAEWERNESARRSARL